MPPLRPPQRASRGRQRAEAPPPVADAPGSPKTPAADAPGSPQRYRPSRQDRLDRVGRLDAGQALVEALVLDRQPGVVDAELVQDGGVDVADVDGVLDDVVAEL